MFYVKCGNKTQEGSGYLARIFMVLTLLTVLVVMSGCGGGNAGNELTDEQLLEMLEARGLEPSPVEEAEYMPVAIIDTSDWVIVTDVNGEFALNIPASWDYRHEEWGGISIFGEYNGTEFLLEAHTMNLDPFEYEGSKAESLSWDYFLFDDGHLGYVLIWPDFITWSNNSMPRHMHLTLHHSGDMSVFTDNEDFVLRIARSMTSASPYTLHETGLATNLDQRLFGTWVLQGDFPYWVILTRTFNPDGTGYWWGDGPTPDEFVWWTDGDVLTMDIYSAEFGATWIDVFRYEIVGDTLTFTDDDGWQRVYYRDDGSRDDWAPPISP